MATAPESSPGKQQREWEEEAEPEPGKTSEADMRCPVCLDLYQEPKMLPCGHLVCARCLVSWLQANAMPRTCPECRAPITEEEICRLPATMTPEEICEALPTELSMAALVVASRRLQAPHLCEKCQEEATCLCLTCSLKLCRQCRRKHAKAFNKKVSKAEAKRETAVAESGTADLGMDEDHPDVPYVALKRHRIEPLTNLTPELLCREQVERCQTHHQFDNNWSVYYCDTHSKALCVHCIRAGLHVAPCQIMTTEVKVAESRKVLREQQDRLAREDRRLKQEYDRLSQKEEEAQKRSGSVQKELDSMMEGMLQGLQKAKDKLTKDIEDSEGLSPETRLKQQTTLLNSFRSDMKNLFAMDGAEELVGQFEDYNQEMKKDMAARCSYACGHSAACLPNCQHAHHYHPTHTHQHHHQQLTHSHQSVHLQEFRSIAETMNSEIDQAVDGLRSSFLQRNMSILRSVNIDALYPNTTNYQDSSSSSEDNPPATKPTYRRHISDID